MRLVAVAQTPENLDGLLHAGLTHPYRLETTLQGGVLLHVLAVLIQRGGADGLQLTTGQHRLEDRGGVDRPFGGTRTTRRPTLQIGCVGDAAAQQFRRVSMIPTGRWSCFPRVRR